MFALFHLIEAKSNVAEASGSEDNSNAASNDAPTPVSFDELGGGKGFNAKMLQVFPVLFG